MAETKITLAQSPEQQQALFGYLLHDERLFEQVQSHMETVGNFSWLNPYLTRLWTAVTQHHETYGVMPSMEEVATSPAILDQDPQIRKRMLRELDESVKARAAFGLEPLLADIRNWQRAVLIDKQVTEMARRYNTGDIQGAIQVIDRLSSRLETLAGVADSLLPSSERVETEKGDRISAEDRLRFGVTFLDESLGGIAPRDLIVVGARTGSGKTQLITRIASANEGKRIALFALEAEMSEIERRAKYHLAYALAQAAGEDIKGVDYDRYISNQAPQLDKHDDRATRLAKKQLAGLRTYYRVSGDFGVDELERKMVSAAKTSDLIILDHLHYVDIDGGKNEHTELAKVIKRIRDIALGYGVPIVVVAHLRKRMGADRSKLVPEIDDIHGASEISKVATSVITFGPVEVEYASRPPWEGSKDSPKSAGKVVWPTIFRVGKHRREGSRTRYAGITFFDPAKGHYEGSYALGALRASDSEWLQLSPERYPGWARSATILLLSVE